MCVSVLVFVCVCAGVCWGRVFGGATTTTTTTLLVGLYLDLLVCGRGELSCCVLIERVCVRVCVYVHARVCVRVCVCARV